MQRKIIYLGYYDDDLHVDEKRNVVRSASTKMDYIASKMVETGHTVDIVSMAETSLTHAVPGRVTPREGGGKTILFPSLPWGGPLRRRLSRAFMRHKLRTYLSFLGANDLVVCYHSLGYADLVASARKRNGFKLVLEVEELYSDVSGRNSDTRTELRIIDAADGFIFCTELLAERLMLRNRPYTVCNGIYSMAPRISEKFDDGLVHVVYAGTFDSRKGGAAAAVDVASFLDSRFHVHILGFGTDADTQLIKAKVTRANSVGRGACVTFDGYKSGEEFDRFIQSCHIGLSPQDPDAKFNTTSFPSKVFMYLCHGLPVASVDLPVFNRNDLRDVLFLSEGNGAEALSSAILRAADSFTADPSRVISLLDSEFGHRLNLVLKDTASKIDRA